MAELESSDPAKPFAPASIFKSRSDDVDEEALTTANLKFRQRKCIKICGCITAIFLILAVVILILSFTVFHVKHPAIKINRIIVSPINNGSQLSTDLTFLADVSVKNQNVASFKFNSGATTVFHGGEVIGDGVSPSGVAEARRTVHVNVTGTVSPRRILNSGSLSMNSSTVIGGKVKISKMIKKHYTVEINCSVIYYLQSQEIQQDCISNFI